MNEYPHILTETEDGLTFEPCAMCERDATIEHEGKGYCRDHALDVMFGIAVIDEAAEDMLGAPVEVMP